MSGSAAKSSIDSLVTAIAKSIHHQLEDKGFLFEDQALKEQRELHRGKKGTGTISGSTLAGIEGLKYISLNGAIQLLEGTEVQSRTQNYIVEHSSKRTRIKEEFGIFYRRKKDMLNALRERAEVRQENYISINYSELTTVPEQVHEMCLEIKRTENPEKQSELNYLIGNALHTYLKKKPRIITTNHLFGLENTVGLRWKHPKRNAYFGCSKKGLKEHLNNQGGVSRSRLKKLIDYEVAICGRPKHATDPLTIKCYHVHSPRDIAQAIPTVEKVRVLLVKRTA